VGQAFSCRIYGNTAGAGAVVMLVFRNRLDQLIVVPIASGEHPAGIGNNALKRIYFLLSDILNTGYQA
jgi:hypothetical protein